MSVIFSEKSFINKFKEYFQLINSNLCANLKIKKYALWEQSIHTFYGVKFLKLLFYTSIIVNSYSKLWIKELKCI
jgi:hypothetical protein